jgi:DNA polymerase III epsilon subunit-like protein
MEPTLLDSTIFSFDIETTGLDPAADRIVQVGSVNSSADGRPRLGFGAHCGVLLADVDRDYLCWCLGGMDDLTDEARALMKEAVGR